MNSPIAADLDIVRRAFRAVAHAASAASAASAAPSGEAARDAYAYPDTDSQMEIGVFSFAKREDERVAWEALVARARRDRGHRAIDVGCGLGGHVAPLRARFAECFFVDRDPGRVAAAARNAGDTVDHGADDAWFFALDLADVARSPEARDALRERFDFVQAIQVLGHLSRARCDNLLRTLAHIAAPGAHVLIAVPFTGQPFDAFVATTYEPHLGMTKPTPRPISPARFDQLADHPEPRKLPVRHFSMGTIHELAQRAALDVVEARPYHWFDELTGDLFALLRRP